MTTQKIEISTTTIIKFIAIILGLWATYYILDVLVLLFIVVLLTIALQPSVTKLTSWGVPKVLSILIVFVAMAAVFGLAVYIIIPSLVTQISELAQNAPTYINKVTNFSASFSAKGTQQILDTISGSLSKLTEGFFGAIIALFGGVISVLTVLVLTFYMLLDEGGIKKALINLIPQKNRARFAVMAQHIVVKMGLWIRGQLTLMIIVGIVTALAMQIIGVPYALSLGVAAGILEIIPVIGPIVAGLLAVLIAIAAGMAIWKIAIVVALYIIIQQLESQLLVPKIMQKAMGVSPIVVIIAILIGGKLLGVGGAILAIPIVGILSVLLQEYFKGRKQEESS